MGFSLIRTNSDVYVWRCDSCGKEYTNAHKAEDCCATLEESIKAAVSDLMTWDELADRVLELEEKIIFMQVERGKMKAAITTPELYVGIISDVIAEERERVVAENLTLRTRNAELEAELSRCREMYRRDA